MTAVYSLLIWYIKIAQNDADVKLLMLDAVMGEYQDALRNYSHDIDALHCILD